MKMEKNTKKKYYSELINIKNNLKQKNFKIMQNRNHVCT